ncbi:MAG: hypothetical protein JWQ60_5469 [Pseudonocardia sp.]|nr:hypothetical protein [Pseudonocardia sp.]
MSDGADQRAEFDDVDLTLLAHLQRDGRAT